MNQGLSIETSAGLHAFTGAHKEQPTQICVNQTNIKHPFQDERTPPTKNASDETVCQLPDMVQPSALEGGVVHHLLRETGLPLIWP